MASFWIERRTTKAGATYQVRGQTSGADGQRMRVTLGTYHNRADAMAAKARFAVRGVAKDSRSTGAYLERWLDMREAAGNIRPNTLSGYRSKLAPVINMIGDVPLAKLTQDHIRDVLSRLTKTGGLKGRPLARASVTQTRNILNKAFADAVGPDGLTHNPVTGVEAPKQRAKRRIRTMSLEQARRFLTALDETPHGPFFRLMSQTGMRRSEVGGLSLDAVDLDRAELRVERTLIRRSEDGRSLWEFAEPKTEHSARVIALRPETVDLLRARITQIKEDRLATGKGYADNRLVFCNQLGEPLNLDALSATARRIRIRLGLPADVLAVHGFRHLFGASANKVGIDPKSIQATMGHSRVSTTFDLYVSVDEDQRRAVADRMTGLL